MKSKKILKKEKALTVCTAVSMALCLAFLCFISKDGERYTENMVSAAITFTPPEKRAPEGLWDIFSEAVVSVLQLK